MIIDAGGGTVDIDGYRIVSLNPSCVQYAGGEVARDGTNVDLL
jgi:hypothetical protein